MKSFDVGMESKFRKYLNTSITALVLVFAIGCGSSGSGDKNKGPVVTFDIPETVNEGEEITLSVTATDSDGTIREYNWTQTEGPDVEFVQNRDSITFTAPQVDADTAIEFLVRVADDVGAVTQAQLRITVLNVNKLAKSLIQAKLKISKVSKSNGYEDNRWFEVSNYGDSTVDLATISLKTESINSINMLVASNEVFALPAILLEPGQSVVYTDSLSHQLWSNGSSTYRIINEKPNYTNPYWSKSGALELINRQSGESIHSVTWKTETLNSIDNFRSFEQ